MDKPKALELDDELVHTWFELSYAQYLTVPRSILQSMPVEWQRRFVGCLEELEERFVQWPRDGLSYTVHLRNHRGKFVHDPLADYERGWRLVTPDRVKELRG